MHCQTTQAIQHHAANLVLLLAAFFFFFVSSIFKEQKISIKVGRSLIAKTAQASKFFFFFIIFFDLKKKNSKQFQTLATNFFLNFVFNSILPKIFFFYQIGTANAMLSPHQISDQHLQQSTWPLLIVFPASRYVLHLPGFCSPILCAL